MKPSTSPSIFASNLQEVIRLARICLDAEEFAEFIRQLAGKRKGVR